MKKAVYLFAFLAFVGMTFLTACGGDDDDDDLSPTITFIGGAGYVADDVTLVIGEAFTVGVNASQNASSGKKLENFTVVRTFNNTPTTVLDSTLDDDTFTWEDTFNGLTDEGVERWTFTITDKDGESSEISFNITTEGASGPIDTHGPSVMGSWQAASGSYYASANGAVYKQSEVAGHEAEVDFVFYYGNTNAATLCAPNDAELQAGGSLETDYVCHNWTSPNATKFGNAVTVTWADVTDDALIVPEATGLTATAATNLTASDIIPFETAGGKKGLIQVSSITGGYGDGEITINVKVQQ